VAFFLLQTFAPTLASAPAPAPAPAPFFVEGSLPSALDFARGACRKLLGGEVDADALAEGGFLKRVNQSDLLRMAGLGSGDKAERAPREEDESLRKQNCYSLAVELLKASQTFTEPYPDPGPDPDPDPTATLA
jgi:hypothetical protein